MNTHTLKLKDKLMMRINLINLPAAAAALIIRKITDTYFRRKKPRKRSLVQIIKHLVYKNAVPLCIVGATIFYAIKQIRRGNGLARTNSRAAASIRNALSRTSSNWSLEDAPRRRTPRLVQQQCPIISIPSWENLSSSSTLFNSVGGSFESGDNRLQLPSKFDLVKPNEVRDIRKSFQGGMDVSGGDMSCTTSELDIYTPSVVDELTRDQSVPRQNRQSRRRRGVQLFKLPLQNVKRTRSGKIYGYYYKPI